MHVVDVSFLMVSPSLVWEGDHGGCVPFFRKEEGRGWTFYDGNLACCPAPQDLNEVLEASASEDHVVWCRFLDKRLVIAPRPLVVDGLEIPGAEARASAIKATLKQVTSLPGSAVDAADLEAAFRFLSRPSSGEEHPAVTARRATCADIASALAQRGLTPGDARDAAPWFQAQIDAWTGSDDPRQAAMAATAARELDELAELGRQ